MYAWKLVHNGQWDNVKGMEAGEIGLYFDISWKTLSRLMLHRVIPYMHINVLSEMDDQPKLIYYAML